MPQRRRVEAENAIQHAWMRGNRKADIFLADRDRAFFIDELAVTAERYEWTCLSYCLMDNHCHLVIETKRETLGDGMRRFNSRYAQTFNHWYRESGHLYQGKFGSRLVTTSEYLCQLFRYVALNPKTAGLCRAPEDWPWSSHRRMLAGSEGLGYASARVEELLESCGGRTGHRYASLFEPLNAYAVKFGAADPGTWRPDLEVLLNGSSRDDGIRAAKVYGYTLREIASAVGLGVARVAQIARD